MDGTGDDRTIVRTTGKPPKAAIWEDACRNY
jgi:hypothetical protein